MKYIHPLPIIAVALVGLGLLLPAQEAGNRDASPATSDEDKIVPDWQLAFKGLAKSERTAYAKHIVEASRLFNQKRIIEALNEVAEAVKVFDQGPAALNLLGACQVEFRNFDKARDAFEKALELQGQYLKDIEGVKGVTRHRRMRPVINILFNLAEMDFVTQKWQDCHDRILNILPEIAPNNLAMSRLVEFKLLLCKIKLDRVDEARKLTEKYDYLDDNPFHYYANAAMAYHDKDDATAERWRTSARRIFRHPQILAPWEDTLIEFGYVKSFYGSFKSEEE
jgi:tetratricopeptide (TPR) repeat protein